MVNKEYTNQFLYSIRNIHYINRFLKPNTWNQHHKRSFREKRIQPLYIQALQEQKILWHCGVKPTDVSFDV